MTNVVVVLPGLYTACMVRERPMFTQHKGCRIDCGGEEKPLLGRSKTKEEVLRAAQRAREQDEQSICTGLSAAWACKPYVLDAVCFVYTCRRLIDLSNDCR